MIQVTNITDDFYQQQTVNLDGGALVFSIRYYPQQQSWFLEQLEYAGIIIQGLRIGTIPNFLRQFKNSLKIGMACYTSDNFEPKLQQDFSSGYATLYVLTEADVVALEAAINGD